MQSRGEGVSKEINRLRKKKRRGGYSGMKRPVRDPTTCKKESSVLIILGRRTGYLIRGDGRSIEKKQPRVPEEKDDSPELCHTFGRCGLREEKKWGRRSPNWPGEIREVRRGSLAHMGTSGELALKRKQ